MPKRPRFSRWRRLPGAYRFHERKAEEAEDSRLVLYISARVLERAEGLVQRRGLESVQRLCEELLTAAIESEHARDRVEEVAARHGPFEGLDAVASDPDYLTEWTNSRQGGPARGVVRLVSAPVVARNVVEPTAAAPIEDANMILETPAREVVMTHAGLAGDEPRGLIATLRRGEPLEPEAGRELLRALGDLEAQYRGVDRLDRSLAYALHKLAFEGQVLTTEGWAGAVSDAATVTLLRLVQEGVDRVLSGQDIRYFEGTPDPSG